ncbi:MAG: sigma-70 family RNA polymerase sigma factor [Clostridiaceae bacterium]|nr:sigma-70 family RNA polymerase sigma factor [Clostridiaceae bacterium]
MDEQALVRRAQSGDRDAFEQLVRAYESKVYALALRWTNDREDALDASQETFLRVFRFLSSFDARSSFSTWLYRVTINVCKDMAAKRSRVREQPLEKDSGDDNYETQLPDVRYEPELVFEKREQGEILCAAIASLPEEYRSMILLRDLRGLSYREIGDLLELEEGTVKSRISRAREKLRTVLLSSGNFFELSKSNASKGGRSK